MSAKHDQLITVTEKALYPVKGSVYKLEHPYGYTENVFRQNSGWYHIADLEVAEEARCKGIGKALLQASLDHAVGLQAKIIFGAIISRECVLAMQAVFGPDVVNVKCLGDFLISGQNPADIRPTSAMLWYEL